MCLRPANAVLKPNTRFLKNLVRDADSHNAALKKKEEREARMRLRKFREDQQSPSSALRAAGEERSRHHHHAREKDGHSESQRHHHSRDLKDREQTSGRGDRRATRHTDRYATEAIREHRRSRSPERDEQSLGQHMTKGHRRRHNDTDTDTESEEDDDRLTTKRRSHHRHKSLTDPLSTPSREGETEKNSWHARPDSTTSLHQEPVDLDSTHLPPRRTRHQSQSASSSSDSNSNSSVSSDPLSSFIGPRPRDDKTRTTRRGRGFTRTREPGNSISNIDAHFSSGYDPSLDVDAEPHDEQDTRSPKGSNNNNEDTDWDNALEALRDRRAWRAKQADRMREAGFGEDEIKRWEKTATTTSTMSTWSGDGNLGVLDVKWRRKGEGREWDAGKVQDEEEKEDDDALVGDAGAYFEPKDPVAPHRLQKASSSSGANKRSSGGRSRSIDKAWRRPDNGLLKQFRTALG